MQKFKQVIKLIILGPSNSHICSQGKSGLEIVTNTVAFETEFLPFVIKIIYGGVTNCRGAWRKALSDF